VVSGLFDERLVSSSEGESYRRLTSCPIDRLLPGTPLNNPDLLLCFGIVKVLANRAEEEGEADEVEDEVEGEVFRTRGIAGRQTHEGDVLAAKCSNAGGRGAIDWW
jgi:hypothetical protein